MRRERSCESPCNGHLSTGYTLIFVRHEFRIRNHERLAPRTLEDNSGTLGTAAHLKCTETEHTGSLYRAILWEIVHLTS